MTDPHKQAWIVRETNPLAMNDATVETAGVPDTLEFEQTDEQPEEEAVEEAVLSVEHKSFDDMTVAELREVADLFGVDHSGLKKAELIEALNDLPPME